MMDDERKTDKPKEDDGVEHVPPVKPADTGGGSGKPPPPPANP